MRTRGKLKRPANRPTGRPCVKNMDTIVVITPISKAVSLQISPFLYVIADKTIPEISMKIPRRLIPDEIRIHEATANKRTEKTS